MTTIDKIGLAALQRDNLLLRALLAELFHEDPVVTRWKPPVNTDPAVQAVAASIVELCARLSNLEPPPWTLSVPAVDGPFYLVRFAESMKNLKQLCDEESPAELQKWGFLAPPNFLKTA